MKITNFLKPKLVTQAAEAGIKRPASEDDINSQSPKQLKTADENGLKLSPVQEAMVQENRLLAQIKLQAKKTPALHPNIGASWYRALAPEFTKPYFAKLSEFVVKERNNHTVYPTEEDVWSWTRYCQIKEVKVVILGQDPYHNPRQAHGLCFSVPHGVACPPSLLNMYKELQVDIPGFQPPGHGNLTGWAEQGVLLLNASLTVRAHNANSHKDQGWEQLTDAVIKYLNERLAGVVFLLWGSYAQKKGACISKKKHHVLTSVHPSPLSVHRGFFGCRHFSQANALLKKQGHTPIDWGRFNPPQQ